MDVLVARGARRAQAGEPDRDPVPGGEVVLDALVALLALGRRVRAGVELRVALGACRSATLNVAVVWHVSQLAPSWPRWTSLWHEAQAVATPT